MVEDPDDVRGGSSERPRVQFWIAIEAIAQRATRIPFVVLEMGGHPIDRCFYVDALARGIPDTALGGCGLTLMFDRA